MSGRIGPLTAGLLTVATWVMGATPASAHGMLAAFRVEPDNKVRIAAWFDSGDPASGAKVEVFLPDKSLLVKGKMDDDGVYVFSFPEPQPLKVVIYEAMGHLKELNLSADVLSNPSTETGPLHQRDSRQDKDSNQPGTHPSTPFPIRDVILGITFLLAVASFVLSLRNAQALKQRPSGSGNAP